MPGLQNAITAGDQNPHRWRQGRIGGRTHCGKNEAARQNIQSPQERQRAAAAAAAAPASPEHRSLGASSRQSRRAAQVHNRSGDPPHRTIPPPTKSHPLGQPPIASKPVDTSCTYPSIHPIKAKYQSHSSVAGPSSIHLSIHLSGRSQSRQIRHRQLLNPSIHLVVANRV